MLGSRRSRHRFSVTAVLVACGLLSWGTAAGTAGAARADTASTQSASAAAAIPHRVLFDNSKAETAGNADWIISTSQPDPLAQDSTPTAETDWTGALSSWGVALQQTGNYSLKTLPSGSTITYGTSAALDLQNFDTFVLPEPNVLLTSAEKTAVMNFVKNGGGLFVIPNHSGADRNNDGYDGVEVVNDLMSNNSVDSTNPFGFTVDSLSISSENPKAITDTADPVLNGSFGKVTGSIIRSGTTVTLSPSANSSVKGLVYRPGYSGNTGAFFATSTFGSGRVAFWGDSSPIDDGTGQSGNTLYDGWNDTAGTNAELALNATEWLSGGEGDGGGGGTSCTARQLLTNPGFESGATSWSATSGVITNDSGQAARTGSYKAWLSGYGSAHTDTLSQSVTIPSGCSAALSFYLHIDTAETTTTTAYDTLKVQVLNSSGTVLSTMATYSNLNAATGYTRRSFDLSAYAGQTVTLKFTGTEGSVLQTSFVIDDTALDVS
ncbi:immune inhibitor A [Streptomyces himalayensis]|uniref:Immune inhibitor A n=1 Tax=Streptomyces himalayensis subsp. himalayensis TaxID=2756131 RepID=A0A7W0I8L1_9ACTN|nr:immune inhibitor A [Streptomyces himalayensis]MBA2946099.1 immune inhibitor A [Streptomyces himalayensis subsp. himalayensis]